uniref:3'-5' exonuclease domain-containing protein n=1 Tax=Leersia perrieri TaxID=77586 RepID=A0A0D9V234_9ORYZ
MKGPVEVTFLKTSDADDSDDDWCHWHWCPRREAVLCIGGDLALVDVTIPGDDLDTKPWFRQIAPLYRSHRLRAPLVVGLVALRGSAPHDWNMWRRARGLPRRRGNPIRCVAICIGGTHALVYQPEFYQSKYTGGALPFWKDNKLSPLRAFLANRRVTVACVGAREAAEKLAVEWGVDVARPAELTDLFARAFGKEAGVDAAKPLEEPERDRRPYLEKSDWKYAARDAYLCFEIAARCFQKLGVPVGN